MNHRNNQRYIFTHELFAHGTRQGNPHNPPYNSFLPVLKVLKIVFFLGSFFYGASVFASDFAEKVSVDELKYVLNSLGLMASAALVMFMAAGFCMLECGLVRGKSAAVICFKNLFLYALACICYYLVGYNLMFDNVGSWMGSFSPLLHITSAEMNFLARPEDANNLNAVVGGDAFSLGTALFQMVFVATAASIVSGALAERVKLWSFMALVAVLCAIIYPFVGAWTWGGGWLAQMGFQDFAGSTIVHSVGGWVALVGVLFVGPRMGRYNENGLPMPICPSNIPLATLGTFILWLGWLGFNGGSVLSFSSASDAAYIGLVLFNTNIAAAAGVVAAVLVSLFIYRKAQMLLILNGAISGLVAITAGPDIENPLLAMVVGAIGGVLATLTTPMLEKFKIDDVVGAIPAHLVAGIWGTLAVGIFTEASFVTQLIGVVAIGVFVVSTSTVTCFILLKLVGLRVSESSEFLGLDITELGIEAYPEFLSLEGLKDV